MSQPANDDYSQHLSDDEASYHEDASDSGTATNKPKQQQQQVTPTTTTISNIKLPILKKEEYDIWAMEMEHYLEYIDNDVWKVIQNGNSKKRISTGKDGVVRILPPVSPAEIHAVEKERKARTILLMAIPKEHLRRFHGMDDAKEIWEAIRTRFGGNANSKKMQKAILKQQFKRDSFYQNQGAGKKEQNQNCLLTMDDGVVNWGEHTVEEEETNHALMAISSNTEANEIYEKDEKLKKYRRIGMKAVKEKEQLQKTLDSWKDSSKNLWRLINSGMSSIGLGYEIKSNNEVLSYEEEMNFSVFNCTEEDSVGKPLYSRFIKTNDFKGVPHPLSGDYTPKPQEEIDESLYVYGKKGPQEPEPSVSDDRSSEYSTCQSNDSAGSIGTSSEHFVDLESKISRVPQEVYVSKPIITNEKGVSALKLKEEELECYDGKRTRGRVAKPVWTNADRINHANQFVPRPVQLNAGRPNINSVRPNINSGRTNINSIRPRVITVNSNVNTVRSRQPVPTKTSNNFSPKRPQVYQFNQRRHFSKSYSPVRRPIDRNTTKMSYFNAVKGNWSTTVKTSAGYNWRNSSPNSNCDSGPTFIRTVITKGPQGRPKPVQAWNPKGDMLPLEVYVSQPPGFVDPDHPKKVYKVVKSAFLYGTAN
ncbi:hypothetical protein Tco_0882538 [Tanacetum coccineum]